MSTAMAATAPLWFEFDALISGPARLLSPSRGFSETNELINEKSREALRDYASPVTRHEIQIAGRFLNLADEWRKETQFISSSSRIAQSPAYRKIIEMGPGVVRFIIEDLRRQPDHWFTALREITGENPVPDNHRGNLALMAQDWISWAQSRGLA